MLIMKLEKNMAGYVRRLQSKGIHITTFFKINCCRDLTLNLNVFSVREGGKNNLNTIPVHILSNSLFT